MLAAFNGHEPLTFPDYLDAGTGKTLTAEPGGVYDVTPASGRAVPDMPGRWFTTVERPGGKRPAGKVVTASAGLAGEGETSSEEEAADDAAHDEEPETDTPQ